MGGMCQLCLLCLSISKDLPAHPWQQEADRQRSLVQKANAGVKGTIVAGWWMKISVLPKIPDSLGVKSTTEKEVPVSRRTVPYFSECSQRAQPAAAAGLKWMSGNWKFHRGKHLGLSQRVCGL